ncbi:MAG: hypothetical protein HZB75_01750 [Candidatus Saccharibacteria bacterium]|nr:MAG: hypothetical protein HZB75_01750 [Candidatus Saccharibacteria bacterium]
MTIAVEADLREGEYFLAQQREAVDSVMYEYRPVIDAQELLDPDGVMRRRATEMVVERRNNAEAKMSEADPMTDLLGGARMAVAFAEMNQPEAEAAYQNHENDIRTAYTEALLKGGHISEITADLNESGEATIGAMRHWEIFLRAAPKSRPDVCAAEVAEEFMAAAHYHNTTLRNDYYLAAVSPSRPDTKGNTLMVRFLSFDQTVTGKWVRKTQQVYLDNSNTEDANRLLREWGAMPDDDQLGEVAILSRPVLLRKQSFREGVASAAEMLDTFASERLGVPVFCGVPIEGAASKDRYTELLRTSIKREAQIGPEVKRLARDTYDIIAAKNLSFSEENKAYSRMLLASLRKICSDHPEYAEAAFGEEAARHYYEAHERVAAGDSDGAAASIESAFQNSTSVTMCDTVVSEEKSEIDDGPERVQSAAERIEALHCLEIKIKGFTIRKGVKCPACHDVTKRKVNAYETQDAIRCMDRDCGYCINKETGAVITKSRIREKKGDARESSKPKSLTPGRSYRLGVTDYFFARERVSGELQPKFTTDKGEKITGEAARGLEQAIIYYQERPLLWMLWLYE